MYELHEVAKLADISERTLRRYIKKYKLRIGRGSFNKYRFSDEDVKKLILMRTMIRDGYSDQEITESMQKGESILHQETLPSPKPNMFKEMALTIKEQDRKTGKALETMANELRTYELLIRQQLKQQAMLMRKMASIEKEFQTGFWTRFFRFITGNRTEEKPLCHHCGSPNNKLNAFCIGCGTPYLAQPQGCAG